VGLESIFKLSLIMNMVDKMSGPLERVKTSVGSKFNAIGASALAESKKFDSFTSNLGGKVKKGLEGLAVGAGAGAVALGAIVLKSAESAEEISRNAEIYGQTTTKIQEMTYVGAKCSVGLDAMNNSSKFLQKNMYGVYTGNKAMKAAFTELGVKALDPVTGKMRDSNDVMAESLDALKKIENPALRNALAMKIFGKGAMQMNPLIEAGGDKLKAWTQAAHDSGAVMSGKTVEGLTSFNKGMTTLKQSVAGALGTALGPFIPKLTQLTTKFGIWAGTMSTKIKPTLAAVSREIKAATAFYERHKAVIDTVVIILGSLGAAFGIVEGALLIYNVVTAIAAGVSTAFGAALAFITSPIGLVVLAIAAVIAIGILLYKNWDKISEFFKKLWQKVVGYFSKAWDWIKNLFGKMKGWIMIVLAVFLPFIGIPLLIVKHWKQITAFFKILWNDIKAGVSKGIDAIKNIWAGFVNRMKAGFDWIKGLFDKMKGWIMIAVAVFLPFIGIPLLVIKHWKQIVAFFGNMWTNIKTGFVVGINKIKEFFTGLPAWFKKSGTKIIDTLVDGIKSAAMKPVTAIKNIFKKIRNLLPFSDAKEGPLATLTLSGHRTMSTLATGIQKGENLPYQAVEKSLNLVNWQIEDGNDGNKKAVQREPLKKISIREIYQTEKTTKETKKEKQIGTKIDRLIMNIDINKIKELAQLFKIVDEIENNINSNALITQGEG